MTQKEVDGNKLIVEFMGYTIKNANEWYNYEQAWLPDGKTHYPTELLKFHKSWDWLMPVVNKIRSLYNSAEIDICYYAEDIISKIAEGCVEANFLQVYESVIEFIIHYNKIKINEKIN